MALERTQGIKPCINRLAIIREVLEKAGLRGQICIILFLMIVLVVLSYFVFA